MHEVSKDAGAAQAISACCQMRTCGSLSTSAGIMWLANGSRLSCGQFGDPHSLTPALTESTSCPHPLAAEAPLGEWSVPTSP